MTGTGIPAQPLRLHAVGASEVGKVRTTNEDRLVIREDLQLFLVADGAGGHEAGDVAAAVAGLSVVNYLEATAADQARLPELDRFGVPRAARWLSRAIHKANHDVREIAAERAGAKGMGSTVVAALFVPETGQLHVAHVGDSRCYRARDGFCDLLTRDHSLAQDVLEERPEVDEAILAKLPRNVVTRALGMTATTRVSVATFEVAPGDRYLLCSDGLWAYVPDQHLRAILTEPRPAGAVAQLLLNAVDDAGAPDNVTVVIVDCPAVDPDGARRRQGLLALESAAASARSLAASEPELLLLGIEELDFSRVLEGSVEPDERTEPDDAATDDESSSPPRPVRRPR